MQTKINSLASKIFIVAAVAALVIIGLVIIYGSGSQNQTTALMTSVTSSPATSGGSATTSPTTNNPGAKPVTTPVQKKPNTAPTISQTPPFIVTVITPVAGDIWKIGQQNPISWSTAGKVTGSISLLDATTKNFIGIITPQIGPAQTSYTWPTRSISMSRTNPTTKDVAPGNYVIQISFDGNNLKPITSQPFTITN
jgi:hypothetical protein